MIAGRGMVKFGLEEPALGVGVAGTSVAGPSVVPPEHAVPTSRSPVMAKERALRARPFSWVPITRRRWSWGSLRGS